MSTTLNPEIRIAHAVSVMPTRLALPWKCSITIWLIGEGQAEKHSSSAAIASSLRSVRKDAFQ